MLTHPKYMQLHPKSGSQDVYIAHDRMNGWFKIGLTGYNLELYRRRLCYDTFGKRNFDKIEMRYHWPFNDYLSAWYVEQTAIAILENIGFRRVRKRDWFDIDLPTLKIFAKDIIKPIADKIYEWEQDNLFSEDNAIRWGTDYGIKAKSIGHEELLRRAQSTSPRGNKTATTTRPN